ncbi:MAG: hypothetical protein HAW64_02180 [Alphaproteobacteria bacterium]|nr:hypothetical protein [Alphaproteobacteria bacterium]
MERKSHLGKWLLSVLALHGVLIAWLVLDPPLAPFMQTADGADETALLLWTRYTARISFVYFLFTFIASPLRGLMGGLIANATTKFIRQYRRELGLSFALSHTIHLGALIAYLTSGDYPAPASLLIGGGLGYLAMFLMAATSTQWGYTRLGVNGWRYLHKTGIHILALIFAFVYSGKAIAEPSPIHIALFSALVLCYVLRLIDFFRKRSRQ